MRKHTETHGFQFINFISFQTFKSYISFIVPFHCLINYSSVRLVFCFFVIRRTRISVCFYLNMYSTRRVPFFIIFFFFTYLYSFSHWLGFPSLFSIAINNDIQYGLCTTLVSYTRLMYTGHFVLRLFQTTIVFGTYKNKMNRSEN